MAVIVGELYLPFKPKYNAKMASRGSGVGFLTVETQHKKTSDYLLTNFLYCDIINQQQTSD